MWDLDVIATLFMLKEKMSKKLKKFEPFSVKIVSDWDGGSLVIDESNFKFAISLLENAIEELDELGKLCFYIAYVSCGKAIDMVYWYCDDTNKKAEWVAEKMNFYDFDGDDNKIFVAYEYEHILLKDNGRALAYEFKCDYAYLDFDIKKIEYEKFNVLTDEHLQKVPVDDNFVCIVFDGANGAEKALNIFLENVVREFKQLEDNNEEENGLKD